MTRRLTRLAVLVMLAAVLIVTRSGWLPLPAEWLVVNDTLQPSDVILVLRSSVLVSERSAALSERGEEGAEELPHQAHASEAIGGIIPA